MDSETLGLVVALFLVAVTGWKVAKESVPDSVDDFVDVLGGTLSAVGVLVAVLAFGAMVWLTAVALVT